MRRSSAVVQSIFPAISRFALIAGEPPALPVFASLIQIKFAF
jgi:hypothetical protein